LIQHCLALNIKKIRYKILYYLGNSEELCVNQRVDDVDCSDVQVIVLDYLDVKVLNDLKPPNKILKELLF